MSDERSETVVVRLLKVKTKFYDYIDKHGLKPSVAVRHFIQQGVNESGGLSHKDKEQLNNDLVSIKRELRGIGVNLNQTARYFNQQGYLIESDLHRNHTHLLEQQKQLTKLLNTVLSKL